MITSTSNPKIKSVRSLQAGSRARREQGRFVVEGVRLVEEALEAGWQAHLVLHTEDLTGRGKSVVEGYAAQGAQIEVVAPHVMQSASDTQSPQGLLVVLEGGRLPLPKSPDFIIIPAGVRDPGNLGTILRTALAAGVHAALLPPGTVDPFSPKVLRSGMGAHFRLPIAILDWPEIEQMLQPLQVFLADCKGGIAYTQADLRPPLALIVGGEAAGGGPKVYKLADARIHIPMPGNIESLNAAMAAGILIFEVVRQRGKKAKSEP